MKPSLASLTDLSRFVARGGMAAWSARYDAEREAVGAVVSRPSSTNLEVAAAVARASEKLGPAAGAHALGEVLERHLPAVGMPPISDHGYHGQKAALGALRLLRFPEENAWPARGQAAPEIFRAVVGRLAARLPPASEPYDSGMYELPMVWAAHAVVVEPALAAASPALADYLLQGLSNMRGEAEARRKRGMTSGFSSAFTESQRFESVYGGLAVVLERAPALPEGFISRLRAELEGHPRQAVPPALLAALDAREARDAAASPSATALVPYEAPRPTSSVLVEPEKELRMEKAKGLGYSVGGYALLVGGALLLSAPVGLLGALVMVNGLRHALRWGETAPRPAGYDRQDLEDVERFLEESREPPGKS